MKGHLSRVLERHAAESVGWGVVEDVRNVGFVVGRLGVRVLPCVIGFLGGVGVGRVVGFEGLVNPGEGEAAEAGEMVAQKLEGKLVEWKVLDGKTEGWGGGDLESGDEDEDVEPERRKGAFGARRGIQGSKIRANEDDDDDWN